MESKEGSTAWSWGEQRRYLRAIGPYFLASLLFVVAGTVWGIATSVYAPGLSSARRETLGEFARLFIALPKPYLALAIFLNNALKTLVVIVGGLLGGILPLIFLLVNGYILGILLHASIESKGILAFFLSIAPHGLIELTAVLLGTSVGLMLGASAIRQLFGRVDVPLANELARGLRFFILVIVPLLIFAALIEAFITSAVAAR